MGPAITILTPHMKKRMKLLEPKNMFMLELLKEVAMKKARMPFANSYGTQKGKINERYS